MFCDSCKIVTSDAKTSIEFGIICDAGSVKPYIPVSLISYSNVTFVFNSYFTQSIDAPVAISVLK